MTSKIDKLRADEKKYRDRLRILKKLRNTIRLHENFNDEKAHVEIQCAKSGLFHLVFLCAERDMRVSIAYFSSAKRFRGFRMFYPYPNFKNQTRRDFRMQEKGISKGYKPPEIAIIEAVESAANYLMSQNAFTEDDVLKVFYTDKFIG